MVKVDADLGCQHKGLLDEQQGGQDDWKYEDHTLSAKGVLSKSGHKKKALFLLLSLFSSKVEIV